MPNLIVQVVENSNRKVESKPSYFLLGQKEVTVVTTNIEQAVAVWVIDRLQTIIDLYFGTSDTKGEVLTRDIAVYEKSTFRTLLKYHGYNLLRERDEELQTWGRVHLSDEETASIMTQVNVAINDWVKQWVIFTKSNPSVIVSDITAKRSKVLLWFVMSEKTWSDSKAVIDEFMLKIKEKYFGYYIYPFSHAKDKETFEASWPNLKFISSEELRDEILNGIKEKLNDDADISLISLYVTHAVENLYDINNKLIEDSEISSSHKDIIKQKQQDFIDYVTQQVFGDKGYLYGSMRENIPSSVAQGKIPGIGDFTNFMMARAMTESYVNLHLSDDKGNVYDKKDLEEVISLNKNFVSKVVIPKYEQELAKTEDTVTVVDSTDTAFGYDIPSEKQIEEAYDSLIEKTDDISDKLDKSIYSTFSQEDLADWYKAIMDCGEEVSSDTEVDLTFIEPLTEAAVNKLESAVKGLVTPEPLTAVKSTYKDNSVKRNSGRITNWKRYYPAGVTDTERTSTFVRYYPGVTDDSQLYADRVSGWNRFYPYEAVEEERISDWKRYYPSNVSTDTRVAGDSWQRYVPDKGTVASDFLPTYRTFSGHDMVVTVQVPLSTKTSITKIIGAFQTISYSIHNEKSPVRVLGDMNPKRYVFGPRMIAGSLILTVFDRHWMRELFNEYVKIKNETERYFLIDELPAMNITISCVNEYGHNAKLALYGVTIVNEGQVMSINDVYTENTYEFFALNVEYLDRVTSTVAQKGSSKNANVPVENVHQETVPSLGEDGISETVPSLEEKSELSEAVQTLKEAPQVINNYGLDIKYDNAYRAVVDDYKAEKISQDKAASKLRDIENTEKKERFAAWEKEIYNPKYQDLLSYFKLKESDIKNTDTLKKKLGDDYDTFTDLLTLYQQSYNEMKQNIWEEAYARAVTIGFEPIGLTVTGEDPSEESGAIEESDSEGSDDGEIRVQLESIGSNFYNDEEVPEVSIVR